MCKLGLDVNTKIDQYIGVSMQLTLTDVVEFNGRRFYGGLTLHYRLRASFMTVS